MKVARVIAVAIVTTSLGLFAQGYVVPDGVTYAGYDPFLGADIHILQNPTNTHFTGFTLPPQNSETFLFNPVLDNGARTFIVSANDPISLQPILAGDYVEMTYPNTYVFPVSETFYLGFYTGNSFPQNGIYADPVFGWGEFLNNNGVIQLLDSALNTAGGIYAGTQNIIPVPEPTTLGLFALGGLILRLRCWRNRSA